MILFQNEITPVSRHKGPAVTWLRHTAMSRDMAVLWNTGMAGAGVWLGAAVCGWARLAGVTIQTAMSRVT